MPYALLACAQPGRSHDSAEIVDGCSKVLINNNIIELRAMPHLVLCDVEAAGDGRGVDPELAQTLFLPLVSGRPEGTGLGLPLCQEIAREHGGMLSHRSRPGDTVFTLRLPVSDAHG